MTQEACALSRNPRLWFESADDSLQVVRIAIAQGSKNLAAFELEQAIDKYLQGFLITRGRNPETEPDIAVLADEAQAKEPRFRKFAPFCRKLIPYLEARYPPLLGDKPTFEELHTDAEVTKELGALARELAGGAA